MSLKRQAISGVKWNFVQQFSVQIINFAVQVILARLLMPEMFGLIAMIIVFISIGQSLMDSGMTSSLIRTENPTQIDYSTVFITNMIMSITIYSFIYLLAPYIARFYDQEVLTNIVRVFALSFIINAFVAVHIAKLTKEMNFKKQMTLQVPSTLLSGLIGIMTAYMGYGVWSLVWMNLARSLLFAIQAWIFIDWKPSFLFNIERFLYHFKFGYKLTLSSLIDTIYNDSYRIVIGKFFNPAAVGFFNHAENMRLFPVNQIGSVLGKVTYPLFSSISNDEDLKRAYAITMKLILLVTTPLMLSLILIAEEGFRFVFGEKWLQSVPYFQVLALASIIRPLSTYNLNILKVKGRSDLFLKLEVLKKVIGVVFLIIGLKFGIEGLVISLTTYSFISCFINMYYSGKLISYSLIQQLTDIKHLYIVAVIVMVLMLIIKSYLDYYIQFDLLRVILYSLCLISLYLITILSYDKRLYLTIKNYKKD